MKLCSLNLIVSVTISTFLCGTCQAASCPSEPLNPQLNPYFLTGFWYEYLYTNMTLSLDSCSVLKVLCRLAENGSTCMTFNSQAKANEILTGVLFQNNTGLFLNGSRINVKFQEDFALIWSCDRNTTQVRGTLLARVQPDEAEKDMWQAFLELRRNMVKAPKILEGFPAGIWEKSKLAPCSGSKGTFSTFEALFIMIIFIGQSTFVKSVFLCL